MFKIDILFRQITNSSGSIPNATRVGGWSEGWYIDGTLPFVKTAVEAYCRQRARLLTTAAQIVGQRYRLVDGGSSVSNRIFPGIGSANSDIPQMAMLCSIQGSSTPNVRRFALRGLPDISVFEGEFLPTTYMVTQYNAFAQMLQDQFFRFKARDLTQQRFKIQTLDSTGHLTLQADAVYTVGQRLDLLKVRDADGLPFTGQVVITARADARNYTVSPAPSLTSAVGSVRLHGTVFPTVDKTTFSTVRITTHKVGRDFFSFRGRASARR
jgi:hypothetical protein